MQVEDLMMMVLWYAHLAPEHLAEYANNILDNDEHIFWVRLKRQA